MKVYIRYGELSEVIQTIESYTTTTGDNINFGIDVDGLWMEATEEQEDIILLLFGNSKNATVL